MSTAELTRGAPTRLLLTIRQVAEATGFCEKTIWQNTAPRGRLACVRVGRSVRYSSPAVERWLAKQTVEAEMVERVDPPLADLPAAAAQ